MGVKWRDAPDASGRLASFSLYVKKLGKLEKNKGRGGEREQEGKKGRKRDGEEEKGRVEGERREGKSEGRER